MTAPKIIQYLKIKLTKEVNDLYSENNTTLIKEGSEGRWQRRRTLGSPRPTGHLDSTYTCLNNPENHQRISRMESPEPSADERPTEEGRKGGEAVHATRTGRREPGRRGRLPTKQSPRVWLGKAEGPDRVCSDSKQDLASGRS